MPLYSLEPSGGIDYNSSGKDKAISDEGKIVGQRIYLFIWLTLLVEAGELPFEGKSACSWDNTMALHYQQVTHIK